MQRDAEVEATLRRVSPLTTIAWAEYDRLKRVERLALGFAKGVEHILGSGNPNPSSGEIRMLLGEARQLKAEIEGGK